MISLTCFTMTTGASVEVVEVVEVVEEVVVVVVEVGIWVVVSAVSLSELVSVVS